MSVAAGEGDYFFPIAPKLKAWHPMVMIDPSTKLIAVVGPTASGKSDLALTLAKKYDGEILCADSRTVYRGLDIGAAKPSDDDRRAVPHHLLDLVDPDEMLSVAAFKQAAEQAAAEVATRGHVPFLVGGSGLYIDSVLYDYSFPPIADKVARTELESYSNQDLVERLKRLDPEAALITDLANRRRVIRALETVGQPRLRRDSIRPNTLVLGIALNKEVMQRRIEQRIGIMLSQGFFEEVKRLGEQYGWDCEAMSGIGYRAFKEAANGGMTVEQAAKQFVRGDMRLVKKQLTWFKRNQDIHWVSNHAQAEEFVTAFLAN